MNRKDRKDRKEIENEKNWLIKHLGYLCMCATCVFLII